MRQRRKVCRPVRKLVPGSELFDLVVYLLRKRFSPQQIVGKLRAMEFPNFEDTFVCRRIATHYNNCSILPSQAAKCGHAPRIASSPMSQAISGPCTVFW